MAHSSLIHELGGVNVVVNGSGELVVDMAVSVVLATQGPERL